LSEPTGWPKVGPDPRTEGRRPQNRRRPYPDTGGRPTPEPAGGDLRTAGDRTQKPAGDRPHNRRAATPSLRETGPRNGGRPTPETAGGDHITAGDRTQKPAGDRPQNRMGEVAREEKERNGRPCPIQLRGIAFDLSRVSRGIAGYRGGSQGIAHVCAFCDGGHP
jgi:hypothetical protein